MTLIYYIDGKKFIGNNYKDFEWKKISSLNEEIPALEDLKTGFKCWCLKGFIRYRLTGPAVIFPDNRIQYWLFRKHYSNNVNDWLKEHPNPDLYFDAIEMNETDRILWYLQN
jgi:hypothetical protein